MPITTADLAALKSLDEAEKLYPPRKLPAGAEVVRVAPSPTGLPHLGTAMQVTIDRALANQTGGVFILRIEDTDQTRLVDDAVTAIQDGIKWMGIVPDEGVGYGGNYGPYTQSERLPLYKLAADSLLEKGHAYRCFCSKERIDLLRKNQQQQGLLPGYDGHCRNLSADTIARKLSEGQPFTIRMKIPEKTTIQVHDLVRGPISFDTDTLTDEILMKSDGRFPTYHLAAMVDDHFMRVTTIVRGEEWISSAPKHVLLYQYFGWDMPKLLHTVLLRDTQKRKLSKRLGDTSIRWFEHQGYLPDGFRNFITRVMWAHPGEKDVYPYQEFIDLMKTSDLPATGPVADFALLGFINGKYITDMTVDARYDAMCHYFNKLIERGEGLTLEIYNGEQRDTIEYSHDTLTAFSKAFRADPDFSKRVFALEPERIRRLGDVIEQYGFLFKPLYTPPTVEQILKNAGSVDKAKTILTDYLGVGHNGGETHEEWDLRLRAIGEKIADKPKAVFMTIRLAITGKEKSPPVYETAEILGPAEVKRRMEMVLTNMS